MVRSRNATEDTNQSGELPPPIWVPSDDTIRRSNIDAVMRIKSFATYDELFKWSVQQPEQFWAYVLEVLQIQFQCRPSSVLGTDSKLISPNWLPGARLNIAESCFQADADAIAIVEGRGANLQATTYGELRRQANEVANGLKRLQLSTGDAVAIFMPMSCRAVAIYLGVILAGCVVVAVADSFSSAQVHLRLKIGKAKAVFTAAALYRGGKRISLYDRVCDFSAPVILADDDLKGSLRRRAGDLSWPEFIGDEDFNDIAYATPDTVINVLFSSGTTSEPKAIPWDHLTPIKAASDGYFHQDIHPGDVVAWPTNFGWMMGPWLTFATLINRGVIALFDGSAAEKAFGEFVQASRVNILGVVPSLVSKWRATGCMEQFDWSSIRVFSSTGECSNADDMCYLSQLAGGRPIIEYCGGTELGGGYLASTVVQPNIPGAFSTPTLGSSFFIFDEAGRPSDIGEVFLLPPLMGMSRTLLNGNHDAVYYEATPSGPYGEQLRRHGDFIELLPAGYFRALGRVDDTMNIGGIKVGAAEIERVLQLVSDIDEVAAIAVPGPHGGPCRLVACVGGLPSERRRKEELQSRLQAQISLRLNPLFRLHDVYVVDHLPRTASNKVMRRQLRTMYETDQLRFARESIS